MTPARTVAGERGKRAWAPPRPARDGSRPRLQPDDGVVAGPSGSGVGAGGNRASTTRKEKGGKTKAKVANTAKKAKTAKTAKTAAAAKGKKASKAAAGPGIRKQPFLPYRPYRAYSNPVHRDSLEL